MVQTGTLYTLGIWTVKPGNESRFVVAWGEFAQWTAVHQKGAGTAVLVQDAESPLRLISFGPWKDREAVLAWRNSTEFKKAFGTFQELCTEIQPHTMLSVASAGKE